MQLKNHKRILVNQRFEAGEMFGFETRNKYQILDENQVQLGFAAEQRKGFFGFILRQMLGHWFKFDVHFFNQARQVFLLAHHPFRWFFTRIELKTPEGKPLGAIEKRFSILTKRFDVENSKGLVIFEVASPIWKIWNFAFKHKGRDVASVNKKWSGLLSEAFTDRDNFMVEFLHADLTDEERQLVMASAVFIDLLYFERKQ